MFLHFGDMTYVFFRTIDDEEEEDADLDLPDEALPEVADDDLDDDIFGLGDEEDDEDDEPDFETHDDIDHL